MGKDDAIQGWLGVRVGGVAVRTSMLSAPPWLGVPSTARARQREGENRGLPPAPQGVARRRILTTPS